MEIFHVKEHNIENGSTLAGKGLLTYMRKIPK